MQTTLVAGETLNYLASVPQYPASAGWTLTLYLNRLAGGTAVNYTSTASGDDHLLQVSGTTTAAWSAGAYGWQIWATLGAERYQISQGQLEVRPSLIGAAAGTDTRTAAEVALDAVQSMIRGTATSGVLSYQINGRELRRYSMAELLMLESKLQTDVARERNAARVAAGLKSSRKIAVRLGRA